ncbi:MAG TPA: S-layer homology domain-containing protein [Anaerovoracaceae bacterium]|nr:S-layer homology domain-containing protein [Anaerovoracaceae bacterium]
MKKFLGIVLAVSLVLTSAIPVLGAETDSKGLEQAILKVKSIVTIPDDYKDFQYSSNQYEDNGKTVSVWDLNWNTDDYSSGISATVEDGGALINYNKYYKNQNEGLGAISREAGEKTAAAFLAKVRPDIAADLRLEKNTDASASDRHYYRYKLYKNDTVVSYVEASVEIDRHTGEVLGYYLQGASEDLTKLPSTDGAIGLEAAKAAWLEKINVPLSYYSYYDYDKKLLTIFPAYSGSNKEGKAIDARTGEAVSLYNGDYYYGGMGGAAMKNMAADQETAAGLTREELAAVENISGLISKEKAESMIRSSVPGITSSMKVTNTSLQKNYAEKDKYQWQINFEDAYGAVNAKTGELLSFYLYTDNSNKGGSALSEPKAKEKAESFLKKLAPEKFAQSRFYENPGYIVYKIAASDVTEYRFNYYRQVNGIDFVDNGFSITVNKASGMITQYNCDWYDSAEFPAIDSVITEEAAFDYINGWGEFGLAYKKVNEGETALVYDFLNSDGNSLIEPFTGARLGYDGEPYKDRSIPEYTDISGHWAEATIKKLLENGYYLEGEKFNPGQKITQIGFLRYLYSPMQSYYNDEDFYKMLINDKVVKEGEKAPKAEITRQDAAKFTVRFLGLGKAAEHPEIFIAPFKDGVGNEYKGYVAICYGLKIMQGDKSGRFNGTNPVTNAEAAVIIYNALQAR